MTGTKPKSGRAASGRGGGKARQSPSRSASSAGAPRRPAGTKAKSSRAKAKSSAAHGPAETVARRNILVIYNPVAGWRRRGRFRRTLRHLARLGCVVAVRETMGQGEARRFAQEAIGEGFDAIAIAGGDGTINEAAGALFWTRETMAVIPLGTANVLAHEIALPRAPAAIAETIVGGATREISVGRIGERHFVVMAGVGFDARVVAAVRPLLKRLTGKFAYVASAVLEVMRSQSAHFDLTIDGKPTAAAAAVIANGRFYAGRFTVAPRARIDEPVLHVALFERTGRWNALRYGVAMVLGRLERLPDVRVVEANSGRIAGNDGQPVQADGDLVGHVPCAFGLARRRLKLVIPN